jgi:hypothetical protein
MKNHKRMLLACLTVAVAMFAVSASSASAAVWKDKGVNVSKFISIGLTGGENFEFEGANGMNCEIHATLTTEGGSTGKITAWEIKKCTGFGTYSTCEANVKEAKGLPWTVDVNATDLTITNMKVKRSFKNCAKGELEKTVASSTVVLNTPSEITEMEFSGTNETYKQFGSFKVDAPNSGTYGIG